MKTILITDTHFGVKNNSKVWCDYQIDFIDKTIIPLIKKIKQNDECRIIHCGDVFDSRSTLSLLIARRIIDKFNEIANLCPIIFVAGNHDYYSPVDDTYCTIPLLFQGNNYSYITKGYQIIDDELFVPFYSFLDKEHLKKVIDKYKPTAIYTHADLELVPDEDYDEILKNIPVFTGHIHSPSFKNNYYTLGSTYPLTFADSNSQRGCYIINDKDYENIKFIPNEQSIKFWRLYDKQIFNIPYEIRPDDFIEIYLNKIFLQEDEYIRRLKELTSQYANCKIIPNDVTNESNTLLDIDFENYDISKIIENIIPENLQDLFHKIITKVKED